MLKDVWKECNVWQRIMAIVYLIGVIAAHVFAIYGLIDVDWITSPAVISPILGRIFLVLLLIACIAFDMLIIVANWFLDD